MNIFDKKEKASLIFIGFLVISNFFVWQELFNFLDSNLEVIFFNVGQGDAIFIETPQKHQILIDGGPDSAVLEKISKNLSFWDKSIDVIILTHPEKDHLTGLTEVLKRYKVDYILWTGVVRDTLEYNNWKELIKNKGAGIIIAKNNQKITAGKALIEILYPFENLEGKELKDSNDTSIVSRLIFGETPFLFTGDISRKTEKKLIEEKISLTADVLKVAHHGSRYSTTDGFLEAVAPKIGIIQVGKNNYGHPVEEVLQKLEKFSVDILRTDKEGDIKIFSDGKNLTIK